MDIIQLRLSLSNIELAIRQHIIGADWTPAQRDRMAREAYLYTLVLDGGAVSVDALERARLFVAAIGREGGAS